MKTYKFDSQIWVADLTHNRSFYNHCEIIRQSPHTQGSMCEVIKQELNKWNATRAFGDLIAFEKSEDFEIFVLTWT